MMTIDSITNYAKIVRYRIFKYYINAMPMKYIYLALIFMIMSCTHKKEINNTLLLSQLDITKEYPVRKVKLDDIADVEYVPLETTNESLMPGSCAFFDISDKYIITHDIFGGDIFLFTRQGKFIRKINHMGQGAKEYLRLNEFVVDFEAEELFVGSYNNKRIFVYNFSGDYVREFPLEVYQVQYYPIYNYNNEYLIACNTYFDSKLQKCLDESPYIFINKQDGSLHSLKIKVPNRLSSYLKAEIVKLDDNSLYTHRASLPIQSMYQNGSEVLIADFTLDTIYSLIGGDYLKPIAVQYPSVRSSNPPVVIAPNVYTDSFMSFRAISMYYDKDDEERPFNEAPQFVWNRRTNKVEQWKVYNFLNRETDILQKPRSGFAQRSLPANTICNFYNAYDLIEVNKTGLLNERLKKIIEGLQEEDNRVLVIVKFK